MRLTMELTKLIDTAMRSGDSKMIAKSEGLVAEAFDYLKEHDEHKYHCYVSMKNNFHPQSRFAVYIAWICIHYHYHSQNYLNTIQSPAQTGCYQVLCG